MVKICIKCKEIKSLDNFHKNHRTSDGLVSACKSCKSVWGKIRYDKNKKKILEYQKRYRVDNKLTIKRKNKAWRVKNAEYISKMGKEYKQKYKKDIKEKLKLYTKSSKGIQTRRSYRKRRYQQIPSIRINLCISGHIRKSILGNKSGRGWESLVGYTLQDLMIHLEKQFQLDMTWSNHGEWHIDHIIPKSAFNYTSPDHIDFKRCWALSNLQPLWRKDNLDKRDKILKPFQPSLRI